LVARNVRFAAGRWQAAKTGRRSIRPFYFSRYHDSKRHGPGFIEKFMVGLQKIDAEWPAEGKGENPPDFSSLFKTRRVLMYK
jgi:hypothetical protein